VRRLVRFGGSRLEPVETAQEERTSADVRPAGGGAVRGGPRPSRARRARLAVTGLSLAASAALGGTLLVRSVASFAAEDERPAVTASVVSKTLPAVSLAAAESGPPVPEAVLQQPPVTRDVLSGGPALVAADGAGPGAEGALVGTVASPPERTDLASPLQVEYTLDPVLTRQVHDFLDRRGVRLAHVVMMDPETGRLLTYVSTDVERFPPGRTYPAASLIKVVTAAAALHHDRERALAPCRFLGSPYTLTPARVDPPRQGQEVSLERALATSNNQCFAQLAVHALGTDAMVDAITRFGFLRPPAPGHSAGMIDAGSDRYGLGMLGCGLKGTWITPLHAAQLGGSLARGRVVEPYWIERVTDASGRPLALPRRRAPRQVLTPDLASELRTMLVSTTVSGTARRGFQNGSLLGRIQVSGKTGSLSGPDPAGRYEWFAGVAPADDPKVAIAVVVVQAGGPWVHASQVAGEVLRLHFCSDGGCGQSAVRSATPARAARSVAARSAKPAKSQVSAARRGTSSATATARKPARASQPTASAKAAPAKAGASARATAKKPAASRPSAKSASPTRKPTASAARKPKQTADVSAPPPRPRTKPQG